MDIRDLYYFQAVAECEHMARAAERLFLTQPALTKAVRRLEESVGATLFTRKGRRIALTEPGRLLLERTYSVRRLMDETVSEVKNYAGGLSGHIRLGCAPTMTRILLPGIMADLLRQAPGVTVELKISISGELLGQLKDGFLDLAFTHVTGPIEGYEVLPLVDDDIVVVAGRNHPIFDGPYTVRDLARYKWVLPKASATRPWLSTALARHDCSPPVVQIEASSVMSLPRLMARTDLLSMLSRRNISGPDDGDLLREVELEETCLRRRFCLVYRKGGYLSPAALRFVELLKTAADSA